MVDVKAVVMKYVIPSLTLALAAGGIGVWLISDHQLLGLGMTGLSLVLWALAHPAPLARPVAARLQGQAPLRRLTRSQSSSTVPRTPGPPSATVFARGGDRTPGTLRVLSGTAAAANLIMARCVVSLSDSLW